MKLQTIACAVAVATGGFFFTHTISQALAATTTTAAVSQSIQPTQEQALVTRQLSTLIDRTHYLNMRLDANTSARILNMYFDSLDPEHSLFLAPEIEQYKKQYGATLGASLKAGDLSGPYAIHAKYRQRLAEFYQFMLDELKKPQNLNQPNEYIDTDREKAAFFGSKAELEDYWRKMLVSQLINLNITKQEEQAKQKALKEDPSLANGQDLTASEDLNLNFPVRFFSANILTLRSYSHQLAVFVVVEELHQGKA